MGASNSKPQVDKAMLLCRERKRFVRQAVEWRHAFAVAHVSYLRSLKGVGIALKKLVEPGALADSSLCTSTSATPEPLAFRDKAVPRFSYASPSMSNPVEATEIPSSPTISSPQSSRRVHVNHMKSSRDISTAIKEEPNIPVSVTIHNLSNVTTRISHSEFAESFPPSPTSSHSKETPPPWDYFDIFPSVDNAYPFQAGTHTNIGFEETDYLEQLREEEGIPDLEDDGERDYITRNSEEVPNLPDQKGFHGRKDDHESERKSESSSEGEVIHNSVTHDRKVSRHFSHNRLPVNEPLTEEEKVTMLDNEEYHVETIPDGGTTGALILKDVRIQREGSPENVVTSKDFVSSIKDIELLFLKASKSGEEVQMMLEANNVHHIPNFAERKEQAPSMLKLTWHQSPSALSSSSRNPLASTSLREYVDDSSNDFGYAFCVNAMNSGSHASTLDRLYAWERKLSDEVKASGFIRREYDMQCKQLRHLQARDEKSERVYKTRARVKDLHSRILVAIQRIDSISRKIEELRDNELQPQLEELVGGLAQMWEVMCECHQNQHAIINAAYLSTQAAFPANSQINKQFAIDLINELSSLNVSFTKWMSAHKSYLKSLCDWLFNCVPQHIKPETRKRRQNMPPSLHEDGVPPIFGTCRVWSDELSKLSIKEISNAVKYLAHEVQCLLPPEEKRTKGSKFTSLSWKIKGHSDVNGYRPVSLEYKEAHANLHTGFDSLQSRLVDFFNELVLFAVKSSKMFEDVKKETTLDAHKTVNC